MFFERSAKLAVKTWVSKGPGFRREGLIRRESARRQAHRAARFATVCERKIGSNDQIFDEQESSPAVCVASRYSPPLLLPSAPPFPVI